MENNCRPTELHLVKIVRKVIHRCKTCTANKSLNYSTQVFQRPLMPALSVGQVLHMDILTHLTTVKDQHQIITQILVVVDRLSRRIYLEPIVADATSTTIINALVKLFTRPHFPKVIIADLDAKFTSRVFKKFLDTYSVNIIFATPSHRQSNGLAERNIRTVSQVLKSYMELFSNWHQYLPIIEYYLNDAKQTRDLMLFRLVQAETMFYQFHNQLIFCKKLFLGMNYRSPKSVNTTMRIQTL